MDAEEKFLALKNAYEDVISNISKEAASRVLASEKRVLKLQPELKIVKEESLRMMMLLKQMMDSKISEEVAASLNKQRKIGELEAQLHEAEDIVRDLRVELAQKWSQLHRLKKENSKHASEPKPVNPHQSNEKLCPELKFQSTLAFDATVPYPNRGHKCCEGSDNMDCTCIPRVQDIYLPSIISRGKESSLFKSRRSLRIRACGEKNALGDVINIPGKNDETKDFGKIEVEGLNKDLSPSKEETKLDTDKDAVLRHGAEDSSDVTEQLPTMFRSRVIDYVYQRKRKRQTKEGSEAQASLETEKIEKGVSEEGDRNSKQAVESS